jgi:hypothetical protein
MKLISKPILKKLTKQIELCRKCKGKKINTFNIKNMTQIDEIEKVNPK